MPRTHPGPMLWLGVLLAIAVAASIAVTLAFVFGRTHDDPSVLSDGCASRDDAVSHGPLVGAVSATTARIWFRACRQVDVAVAYNIAGRDPSTSLESDSVTTDARADSTAVVELVGLSPATRYEFRLVVRGDTATDRTGGAFKTMPADGQSGRLNIMMGTDLHLAEHDPTRLLTSAAAQEPDFALFIGDNIVADEPLQEPPPPESQAVYEAKYRLGWDTIGYKAFRSKIASFSIWDDHEILNDWDRGTTHPYEWARAAYDEYAGISNPPARPGGGVNYIVRAGDVEFYVLDTRTFRSRGEAADGPAKTMLGTVQKADLENWLSTSHARFKFIISSVMWNDFSRHAVLAESWPAFRHERNEIFDFIRSNAIAGVILISGDEHWNGVFHIAP